MAVSITKTYISKVTCPISLRRCEQDKAKEHFLKECTKKYTTEKKAEFNAVLRSIYARRNV